MSGRNRACGTTCIGWLGLDHSSRATAAPVFSYRSMRRLYHWPATRLIVAVLVVVAWSVQLSITSAPLIQSRTPSALVVRKV